MTVSATYTRSGCRYGKLSVYLTTEKMWLWQICVCLHSILCSTSLGSPQFGCCECWLNTPQSRMNWCHSAIVIVACTLVLTSNAQGAVRMSYACRYACPTQGMWQQAHSVHAFLAYHDALSDMVYYHCSVCITWFCNMHSTTCTAQHAQHSMHSTGQDHAWIEWTIVCEQSKLMTELQLTLQQKKEHRMIGMKPAAPHVKGQTLQGCA